MGIPLLKSVKSQRNEVMKVNSRQVVEFNKEIGPLKKKQTWVKQEMKTLGSQVKPQNEASPPEYKKWKRAPQTPQTRKKP